MSWPLLVKDQNFVSLIVDLKSSNQLGSTLPGYCYTHVGSSISYDWTLGKWKYKRSDIIICKTGPYSRVLPCPRHSVHYCISGLVSHGTSHCLYTTTLLYTPLVLILNEADSQEWIVYYKLYWAESSENTDIPDLDLDTIPIETDLIKRDMISFERPDSEEP